MVKNELLKLPLVLLWSWLDDRPDSDAEGAGNGEAGAACAGVAGGGVVRGAGAARATRRAGFGCRPSTLTWGISISAGALDDAAGAEAAGEADCASGCGCGAWADGADGAAGAGVAAGGAACAGAAGVADGSGATCAFTTDDNDTSASAELLRRANRVNRITFPRRPPKQNLQSTSCE